MHQHASAPNPTILEHIADTPVHCMHICNILILVGQETTLKPFSRSTIRKTKSWWEGFSCVIFSSPELCSGRAFMITFRPSCVHPSINIFKQLLFWSCWANFAQISYGASLGWGNERLLTKMAAMPIYGKTFKNLLLQNRTGLGGSVGYAIWLETRRSRVQPPPRSATFFRGDWSWNIFYGHSLPSADSRRAVVSFWRKNVHNTG